MLDRSVSAEPSAASSDDPHHPSQWIFQNERIIGNGSFGVVYQAIVKQNQKARCRDWQHGTLMLRTLAYPAHRVLSVSTSRAIRKALCWPLGRRSPSKKSCKISASRSAWTRVHRPRGWLGMGSVVGTNISHPWTCAVAGSGAGDGEEGQEENHVQRLSPPTFLAIVQNRELQIMKMLDHGNVTTLHHYFYTEGEKVSVARARCESPALPFPPSFVSPSFVSPRPHRILFVHHSPTRPT